ncbi:hypothetical protein BT69DRAFT_1327748 [Atractiella rhizophila]|nr:hypothetical protein BT69DRAFT_1327748 [Atractiella rhizophila]
MEDARREEEREEELEEEQQNAVEAIQYVLEATEPEEFNRRIEERNLSVQQIQVLRISFDKSYRRIQKGKGRQEEPTLSSHHFSNAGLTYRPFSRAGRGAPPLGGGGVFATTPSTIPYNLTETLLLGRDLSTSL